MQQRACSGAMPLLFTRRYPHQKIVPIIIGRRWRGCNCNRLHSSRFFPAAPSPATTLHPSPSVSTPFIVKNAPITTTAATTAAVTVTFAVAAVTATGHDQTTRCEDNNNNNDDVDSATTQTTTAPSTSPSNPTGVTVLPLWPNGVTEKDIDDLVDEILKDPNVNMKFLPDALERRLYNRRYKLR